MTLYDNTQVHKLELAIDNIPQNDYLPFEDGFSATGGVYFIGEKPKKRLFSKCCPYCNLKITKKRTMPVLFSRHNIQRFTKYICPRHRVFCIKVENDYGGL